MLVRVINNLPLFWVLLSLPALEPTLDLFQQNRYYAEIMHHTGVFSMQLMVMTLAITPLAHIAKHWDKGRAVGLWLIKRRRALGVASFAYAALHTAHYIQETADISLIWLEAFDIELAIGWLSLLIMLPLALTSNTESVRALGTKWKSLQRLAYISTAAAFIHWLLIDFFIQQALFWLAIVVIAKAIQIVMKNKNRLNLRLGSA